VDALTVDHDIDAENTVAVIMPAKADSVLLSFNAKASLVRGWLAGEFDEGLDMVVPA
jgi:hypothetical protein